MTSSPTHREEYTREVFDKKGKPLFGLKALQSHRHRDEDVDDGAASQCKTFNERRRSNIASGKIVRTLSFRNFGSCLIAKLALAVAQVNFGENGVGTSTCNRCSLE